MKGFGSWSHAIQAFKTHEDSELHTMATNLLIGINNLIELNY